MSTRQLAPVALGFYFLAPALLHAQTPLSAAANPTPVAAQVGGKFTVDLVTINPDTLGLPLRHGGMVAGSEEVSYNGHKLKAGNDYTVDNDAGVIYLMIPAKPGETVSVSYRYNPALPQSSTTPQSSNLLPFKLSLGGNNSVGVTLGMGLTDRTADGSVSTSNVLGWANSFSAGTTKLSGLALFGDRTQQQARSQFEYQGATKAPDQGKSRLLLQSLGGDLAGGTFQLDYQDVSKNFSGFSAVQANGYDASVANQLAKEKGLRRMGLSFNNLKLGSLGFTDTYKTVGDEKGGITWQTYGLNAGGLSLNYKSQDVGQHFNRFADIAETDRDQLAKEAGLKRQSWDGIYKMGLGSLTFNSSSIDDTAGKGINKEDLKFDSGKFQFDTGSQEVQKGFTRFDSLNDPERGQWSKEVGLKRNWTSISAMVFGAKAQPLKFSDYKIDSPTGDMTSVDASAATQAWSFEHVERSVASGFTALPNLTQQEIDGSIGAISSMYVKGGVPVKPEDRAAFLQSPGLSRDFTRLTLTPSKNWTLGFDTLALTGKKDSAKVSDISLAGKGINVTYRQENLGPQFTELSTMMQFEQHQLGTLPGLDRSDLTLNADIAKSKLALSQTVADTANGGFKRDTMALTGKAMQLTVNSRRVDPKFTAAGQLLDAEAGLLAAMVGYKETDAQLKWQINHTLHLEAETMNGSNATLNQRKNSSNMLVDWDPNKATKLEYQSTSANSSDPADTLLASTIRRLCMTEDFGRAGTLKVLQQDINYDGTQANQPDSKQTDVSYETKLTDTTSVKTEQIRTTYGNGDKEDVSSNTINTELTKQAGLQLTDISIDRKGTANDERKRNVGFWVSLWNGVHLNFGVTDDLNNNGATVTQHTMSLTPGTIGDWQIGSATYSANEWDQTNRIKAASTVSINTVKPFNLGFLKDVKLGIGQDTAADNGAWLKANKTMSFAGRIGKNTLGYDFKSQMTAAQQEGADRAFTFATDQSPTSRLRATLFYKQRSVPGQSDIAIRNFSITAVPFKGFELTNEMSTNPEIPRADVLLGSIPQPMRVNKWKLDYVRDPNFKIAGSWEEQRNDQTGGLSRLSGITFTMFEKTGSPVSIFLGNQFANNNVPNAVADRWSLRWDQKPGPNQMLSIFMGNVTYGGTISPGDRRHNLSLDFEYQFRFGGPNSTAAADDSDTSKS